VRAISTTNVRRAPGVTSSSVLTAFAAPAPPAPTPASR
jgi:hypothetical protein